MLKQLYQSCPACCDSDGDILHVVTMCPMCEDRRFVPYGKVLPPVEHEILERIFAAVGDASDIVYCASLESESIEFVDARTHAHYEIVVRSIDDPEDEAETTTP